MYDALLFAGTRWPAAKVVARQKVVDSDLEHSGRQVPLVDTLIIETTGLGRPYVVDHVEGWWRDLAEFQLDDERRVLSFLQRRGDPFGKLKSDGTQISTYDWRDLKRVLERAAHAWDPQPDETGVSHFHLKKRSRADRMFAMVTGRYADGRAADGQAGRAADGWAEELSVSYRGGITPTHRAKILAAYLCAAAAASVRGGQDMRRCHYCSSWFIMHRSDARWCSSSCRAASSNKKRSPHAFVSQNQNTQGGDSVAEPVAGAGGERPPAGPRAKLRDPKGSGDARRANARGRAPRRRRPAPT
jgi:hypothetical protein